MERDNTSNETKEPEPLTHQIVHVKSKSCKLITEDLREQRVACVPLEPDLIDYYKVLRTQLMQKMRQKEQKTILVTSALTGEGKSLTALNLAFSFATVIDGYVLFVEADLRNPSLQKTLGFDPSFKGLADYLLDDIPINDLLVNPDIGRCRLLPAGRKIPNSAEVLGSTKMKDFVQEVKNRYNNRYIIFDTPSLLEYPDTLVFSEFIDVIVMVVEADSTPQEKIMEAMDMLKDGNLIGFVLNKVSTIKRF